MDLIVIAIVVVVAIGLVAACILSYASKVFYVPVDERVSKLRAELPGANCGGCGFAGCDDYANALVEDPELSINKCPVGGAAVAAKLGEILGKSAEAGEKQLAVVMCNGTRDAVKPLLAYNDIKTCKAAKNLFGGMNACPFGCLGLGDCEAACDFDAIHICDGVAVVNKDACVACGACAKACPNSLIRISPAKNLVVVKCHNTEKGGVARKECSNACIGCMKCQKVCKFDAITVENNLAYIDPEKCKNCGMCAKECPTGAIHDERKKKAAPKKSPEEIEALKKAAADKKAAAAAKKEDAPADSTDAKADDAKEKAADTTAKAADVKADDTKADSAKEKTPVKEVKVETTVEKAEEKAPETVKEVVDESADIGDENV
ncbi:RnfABCDGE type electron transport complex subunit B [Hornefia butyriciproducens]|uniref:RnfABCDGE type electron transport complex subunit B n=1 Tax=Hornefia butyriciproducens TaxID=2652293 RepID=UPI002A9208BB|nr:RnfABCDGE type electron transport complex subunit B [Hornefia butyriciproducens]MDY5462766.1 RnfABCDGE type electron transport complex subunit B [Hornefia butyriciproducens]MDY6210947.1 RnfABCDGE type electron transport complex subunit B [Hornefia butyriciproducens]